ncbi:MAG: hypothetical protein WBG95_11305 [Sulfitobacter sp.]
MEYKAYLRRAETFLQRNMEADGGLNLAATLIPFDNLTAFIVNRNLQVVAPNDGVQQSFGVQEGTNLEAQNLPHETYRAVSENLRSVFLTKDQPTHMLRLELAGTRGTALLQIWRLEAIAGSDRQLALIVTTHYHWKAALVHMLEEVFKLTHDEKGVVRALVEGLDTKSIDAERGTRKGTVRGQIKSIVAKIYARTQSEIIRLALSLRDMSDSAGSQDAPHVVLLALTSTNWLHAEVWKPYKTLTLPDGRRMDYQDMGPADCAPIIRSHMGYGMVGWTEPMIKLAFPHGLRVLCPIRASYGLSTNLDPKTDVLVSTRADTEYLLDQLVIDRLLMSLKAPTCCLRLILPDSFL